MVVNVDSVVYKMYIWSTLDWTSKGSIGLGAKGQIDTQDGAQNRGIFCWTNTNISAAKSYLNFYEEIANSILNKKLQIEENKRESLASKFEKNCVVIGLDDPSQKTPSVMKSQEDF